MANPLQLVLEALGDTPEFRIRRVAAELKQRDGESWAIGEALERLNLIRATLSGEVPMQSVNLEQAMRADTPLRHP